METEIIVAKKRITLSSFWKRILIFLTVFGPATITAMADDDAGGVATYSVAGAELGYPSLFALFWITILLAVTQEMGMRMTLASHKGLGDLIREKWGVRISLLMFGCLLIANLGCLVTELSAVKTTASMLNLPPIPVVLVIVLVSFLFITKGKYKVTQNIMLLACLFFLAYIIAAVKAKPDWGMALSNLVYPHGVVFTPEYLSSYILISMGVLGTTVTPWGQFFISSFAYDKKIEKGKIIYSQIETYWGAFLTSFFAFFMIVATAATLFENNIPLVSGEQAALAIKPFAGELAGTLFAVGILNAAFMGLVVVSLSTAYAFAEFFGLSGSLNDSFKDSKTFYILFMAQLAVATLVILLPGISLFTLAVTTQTINAIALPLVFYYLLKLTNDKRIMGDYANNKFQNTFAIGATIVIVFASIFTVVAAIIRM
jgi:Mn2+/Fe2+ NRAMP family transporter